MEARENGGRVKPMGQMAEVESSAWRLKVKPGHQHNRVKLVTRKSKADPSSWTGSLKEESGAEESQQRQDQGTEWSCQWMREWKVWWVQWCQRRLEAGTRDAPIRIQYGYRA